MGDVNVGSDMGISAAPTEVVGVDAADDEQVLVDDADVATTTSEKSDDWVLAVVVVVVLVAALGVCLACGYMAHQRRRKRASVEDGSAGHHVQIASGSGSSCVEENF